MELYDLIRVNYQDFLGEISQAEFRIIDKRYYDNQDDKYEERKDDPRLILTLKKLSSFESIPGDPIEALWHPGGSHPKITLFEHDFLNTENHIQGTVVQIEKFLPPSINPNGSIPLTPNIRPVPGDFIYIIWVPTGYIINLNFWGRISDFDPRTNIYTIVGAEPISGQFNMNKYVQKYQIGFVNNNGVIGFTMNRNSNILYPKGIWYQKGSPIE